MTDREAMQQALDALEWNLPVIEDYGDREQLNRQHRAITALRERLAQPEPPVLTGIDCSCGKKWRILNNTLTASEPETVMAEYKHQTYAAYKTDGEMKIGVVPEQEQAMLDAITGGTGVMLGGKRIDPSTIYKEPEQEPVAWVTGWHDGHCVIRAVDPAVILPIGTAFYTAPPPQRQWVGLTDDEMHECWDSPLTPLGMKHARMIEAKLREKNT